MNKIVILFLLFSSQIFAQNRLEVYFDFNKFDINNECQLRLDSLIIVNKSLTINRIEGFCDKIDSHSYNEKLSLQRAETVANYLKSRNITFLKNFETKAFGENFIHSKVQSKNRKVVIHFSDNELQNKINQAHKGDFIKLKNINFYNNSNVFLPKTKPVLFELLRILQNSDFLKVEIQGHICCKLPDEEEFISESRAKAVYDFLIYYKIDKNRLQFKGFGVSVPIYPIPEQSEFEREENRRVEILILDN